MNNITEFSDTAIPCQRHISPDMMIFPAASGDTMAPTKSADDWQTEAKGLIRGELKRRNMSYKDLADRLSGIGVHDTDRNIQNKIARGGFTAVFLLQCLEAIGVSSVNLKID